MISPAGPDELALTLGSDDQSPCAVDSVVDLIIASSAGTRSAESMRDRPGFWHRTLAFLAVQHGQSLGRRFRCVGCSAFGGGSCSSLFGSPRSIRWGTANT